MIARFLREIMPRPFVRFLGKERVTELGRKTALFLAILTVAMLTGCNKQTEEAVAETEQVTAVSEVTTTAETTVEVTTATEAETTAAEITSAVEEDNALPAVYSADEKYEYYPLEVIYKKTVRDDVKWTSETLTENFFNNRDVHITEFKAEYPVFEYDSEEVSEKINQQIKAYVDESYEFEKIFATEKGYDDSVYNEEIVDIYEKAGRTDDRILTFEVDSVCGNILSVCVTDYRYTAGAAHGYPLPMPMMFDLRTGEQIKLSEMIGDKEAFAEKYRKSIIDTMFLSRMSYSDDMTMDEYPEFAEGMSYLDAEYTEFGIDENGELIIGYCKADTRLTVKNGCVGFYVAPYEYGSYADGIRLAEVPVNDLLQYMNDEGKALFEGVVSATAEPVMITIEDGKEKIISREQAEKLLSEREE